MVWIAVNMILGVLQRTVTRKGLQIELRLFMLPEVQLVGRGSTDVFRGTCTLAKIGLVTSSRSSLLLVSACK